MAMTIETLIDQDVDCSELTIIELGQTIDESIDLYRDMLPGGRNRPAVRKAINEMIHAFNERIGSRMYKELR